VSYSGKTPTVFVFPVFSVTVMEKCCDARGDDRIFSFGRNSSALQGYGVSLTSNANDQKVDRTYG
jgi:hypothetical protein